MLLAIRHTTHYSFGAPLPYAVQRLRLTPKSTHGQKVLEWKMEVTGGTLVAEHSDHNQNIVELLIAERGVSEVMVSCSGQVDTSDTIGIVGPHKAPAPLWLYQRATALTQPGREIRRLAAKAEGGDPIARLHALSAQVIDAVTWQTGMTDVTTPAEAALQTGAGVCQDHAHIFIAAARLLGFPARYVSGYLRIDGKVDQAAAHGWAEAHIDGLGWVGFDISNRISPDERYVRVATGTDYREAAPVTGVSFGAVDSSLLVQVAVEQ